MNEIEDAKLAFLSQLRLIYLSLLATSFVLLAGNNLQMNSTLDNAFRDAASIRAKRDGVLDWVAKNDPLQLWWQLDALNSKQPTYINYQGTIFSMLGEANDGRGEDISIIGADDSKFASRYWDQYHSVKTLADFEKLWDALHNWPHVVHIAGWHPDKARVAPREAE